MLETVHGEGDVLLGDETEMHASEGELTAEAVHILVGAMLPGGVGMGKEEIDIWFVRTPKPAWAGTSGPSPQSTSEVSWTNQS